MSTNFVWDGTSNDWASDHWGRNGYQPVYPGDSGSDPGDEVIIDLGWVGSPPYGGAPSLTVGRYVSKGVYYDPGSNLTVTGNAELSGGGGGTFSGNVTGQILIWGAVSLSSATVAVSCLRLMDSSAYVNLPASATVGVVQYGGDVPSEADVRLGTQYDALEKTGTMPPAVADQECLRLV